MKITEPLIVPDMYHDIITVQEYEPYCLLFHTSKGEDYIVDLDNVEKLRDYLSTWLASKGVRAW